MKSTRAASVLLPSLFLLLWISPAAAQHSQRQVIVIKEMKHDVSLPARDLVEKTHLVGNRLALLSPKRVIPTGASSLLADVAAQNLSVSRDVGTTNLLNFDGVGANGFAPPDTNGSVGSTQFVETTNVQYAVYDKTTGTQVQAPKNISTFWDGFGGLCDTGPNFSDPIALWDKMAQRWLIAMIAFNNSLSSNAVCTAVSTSSDATGTYNRYAFLFGNTLPDYPKFGIWPDGYYMSFNAFANAGFSFIGSEPCALDRNAMLAGSTATMVCFTPNASDFTFLPSDLDGAALPPAGAPNNFVELFTTTTLHWFKFHVDFAVPANSTFTGPTNINVSSYTQICTSTRACIPQPSPGEKIDDLGDRLMYRLAYRNFGDHEAMVAVHTIKPGGTSTATAATRWYELRATPPGTNFKVFQQGNLQNATASLWMASIGMDKQGNIAVGMSESSSSVKPSVVYTGRLVSDAKGKMQSLSKVISGTGVQQSTSNRWGDYSSMSIDSTDDCTFWFSQEYIKTNGSFNWKTRINSFKFPGCQ